MMKKDYVMILKNLIDINFWINIYMGLKQSKSCATENMKQKKELDIEEKTRTDMLLFNTLKDVIERVKKLEETKSDKIYYKLPNMTLCNY